MLVSRSSLIRDAQVVMDPILRNTVILCQRHSVTEFRHTSEMTIGQRIKDRLSDLGHNAAWLSKATKIPASTLYDLIRGDIQGSTRLPTIAQALGVNAMWLESAKGDMLAGNKNQIREPAPPHYDVSWPFSFDRGRWERLSPGQKLKIEGAITMLIEKFEQPKVKKSAQYHEGRRELQRRSG